MSDTTEVWAAVAERRRGLAARARRFTPAEADSPSWCEGWRVRDVLGHLVHLAEATQWSMARDIVRHGVVPDRSLGRVARSLGDRPVDELADRLEQGAGGRFHVLGTPASVALGELLVHGADMTRALGGDPVGDGERATDDVDPPVVVTVLPVYRRIGRLAFHASPAKSVALVATDTDWTAGDGPEVRGRAIDLLLLLAGRRQVMPWLDGQGVASLR